MIMVNGNTWPFQTVEQRRYRFRFLNGCQSRFLILDFSNIPDVEVWQIGNEGGFLAAPVNLTATNGNRLLMGLAERADVIVDFTNVPARQLRARQRGARTSPSRGSTPTARSPTGKAAHCQRPILTRPGRSCSSTSCPALAADPTTPPMFLQLPAIAPLPTRDGHPPAGALEKMGMCFDALGAPVEGPLRRCSAPWVPTA